MSDTFTKREVALLSKYIKDGYSLDNAIILLRGNPAAAVPAQGARIPCPHDMGFDDEIGPLGCLLVAKELACVCEHMHFATTPSTEAPAQAVQVPCPVCGGEAIHALDVLRRTIIREPIAWDANDNRSYEPVETLAAEIYEGFVYDGPPNTTKPKWTAGGNGLKQDEARFAARRRLREAGHTPSVSSTDRGTP